MLIVNRQPNEPRPPDPIVGIEFAGREQRGNWCLRINDSGNGWWSFCMVYQGEKTPISRMNVKIEKLRELRDALNEILMQESR